MADALSDVGQGMLKGEGIAEPMSKNELFLPMMVAMVRVGEESGGLGETLGVVAETYEAEAEGKTLTFSRLIQTVVTMGISIVVFLIVLTMFSAMYGIYGEVSF
jgi:type II secretory pathway component PulF